MPVGGIEEEGNDDVGDEEEGSTSKKRKLSTITRPTIGRSVRGEDFWSRIAGELKNLLAKNKDSDSGKADPTAVLQ